MSALFIALSGSFIGAAPRAEGSIVEVATSSPDVRLTPTQWKAAKLARDARNKAMRADGMAMDYRRMKTIFGTKSKTRIGWRREMAAGFRQAGGRLTHISKAEARLVERRRRQIYASDALLARDQSSTRRKPDPGGDCKGRTGTVVKGKTSYQYLDSCEVIDLTYAWGTCASTMGAIGFFASSSKRVSWPAYLIGAFCVYWAGELARAAAKSDDHAIYIQTYKAEAYRPYPGGVRYHIRTTVHPQ